MQLPYFFEEQLLQNTSSFVLSDETAKHCARVLRMGVADKLQLTNGNGLLCKAIIKASDKKTCVVKIEDATVVEKKIAKPSIGISLLKNPARFEWFLEKAVEIGVDEIIPLLCERTEKEHFRFDRMQGILVSAMLQSRQVWLPKLHQPTAFNEVIASSSSSHKLIAHCEEEEKIILQEWKQNGDVQILIGPEGDFTREEIATAKAKGFVGAGLGNTRLRTETAGIVAVTLLNRNVR
jgi:16S rRNA (uracil1498-N3)-methyltransferase